MTSFEPNHRLDDGCRRPARCPIADVAGSSTRRAPSTADGRVGGWRPVGPGGEVVAKSVVNIEQSSLVGLLGVLGDIVVDAGERWRWSRAS